MDSRVYKIGELTEFISLLSQGPRMTEEKKAKIEEYEKEIEELRKELKK